MSGAAHSVHAKAEACDVLISFDFPPMIGGAHLWMYEMYRRWHAPVAVLTAWLDGDAARDFDAKTHGVLRISRIVEPASEINLLSGALWRAVRTQVRQLAGLTENRPVRLHVLRAFPEGLLAAAYKAAHRGVRIVTYVHGEELLIAQTSRQLSWIARQVYRRSDVLIANSHSTRDLLHEFCPSVNAEIVHPGVDARAFAVSAADAASFRLAWSWPAETVVFATVARMERRKNHEAVVRAVAALRQRGVNVAYLCAGSGPEQAALKSLARELRIDSWVKFPGAVAEHEKRLIFASCDVHVMPSIRIGEMIEGFGIVFLEAGAAGVPSIGGNNGGQGEAVCHGRTGLLVDGSDTAQLTEAMSTLASDPTLRARMGEEGRRWAAEHDWSRVVKEAQAKIGAL